MSLFIDVAVDRSRWTGRSAGWVLAALHIPLLLFAPLTTVLGVFAEPRRVVPVAALTLVIGGLQLRHSMATARGQRPQGWQWTGLALILSVYPPMLFYRWDWVVMQCFVVASALMLLTGRLAVIVAAAPIVATSAAIVWEGLSTREASLAWNLDVVFTAFDTVYVAAVLAVGGVGLYGAARLFRVLDELQATRTELAELAVGRERLRLSRDLHDLLGQSLSAVSLKGDLALRLLRSDPAVARAEIEGLTGVARDALRDIRKVTRDQHSVTLDTEVAGAAALLAAASIDTRVDVDLPNLPRAAEQVLAWAVREGVANVLRHSEAHSCSITGTRRSGHVLVEIVNDGVHLSAPTEPGSGVTGLSDRAMTLGGSLSAERISDDRFKLRIEIPEHGA